MRLGFLLVLVLSIGLVSAVSVCIDNVDPSAPSNLSVSGNVGSILLEWGEANDEPDCSEIAEYVISREGDWIETVARDVLSFVDGDVLSAGEYVYTVYAVDLVGHNTGAAIKNVVKVGGNDENRRGGVSGGGSSYSYVCVEDWSCDEWSECVGNEMRRLCNDLNKCGTESEKPDSYQECGLMSGDDGKVLEMSGEVVDVSGFNGFFSAITGAVIGGGATSWGIAGIFVVLVVGSFGFVRIRRKRKLRK